MNVFLCFICKDKLLSGESHTCVGKCGHCFHTTCLHQTLLQINKCPECNTKYIKSTLVKVSLNFAPEDNKSNLTAPLQVVTDLTDQVARLQAELTYQKELVQLGKDVLAREVKNQEQLQVKNGQLESQVVAMTGVYEEMKRLGLQNIHLVEIESLKKDLNQQTELIKRAYEAVKASTEKQRQAEVANEQLQAQLKFLRASDEQQLQKLTLQLQAEKDKCQRVVAELTSEKEALKEAKNKVVALKQKAAEAQAEIDTLSCRVSNYSSIKVNLIARINALEQKNAKLKQKLSKGQSGKSSRPQHETVDPLCLTTPISLTSANPSMPSLEKFTASLKRSVISCSGGSSTEDKKDVKKAKLVPSKKN